MASPKPRITVKRGRVVDSTPPQGSSWPEFPNGLPDGDYVLTSHPAGASPGDGMAVIRRGEREWSIEDSAEGIPLVYGDGKYPHDPPRVASLLESALHEQLAGAVEALAGLVRLKDGPRDDAYRAAKDAAWQRARDVLGRQS